MSSSRSIRHCVKLSLAKAGSQPGFTATANPSPAAVNARVSWQTGVPALRTIAQSPVTCSGGFGGAAAAAANAVRLAINVTGGLIAIYWLDLGMVGFFASVALGFVVYAALLVWAVLRVKEPAVTPKGA